MDSFFVFESYFGGEERFNNAIHKAKRILKTKLEYLDQETNKLVPFGFDLGKQFGKQIWNGNKNLYSIWFDFEISFFQTHKQDNENWIKEIFQDTNLFTACELFNLCINFEHKDRFAQLAYELLFQSQTILSISTSQQVNTNILCLVTKVPKIGRTKTRLGKSIGNEKAYQFGLSCLLDLVERLTKELTPLVHKFNLIFALLIENFF